MGRPKLHASKAECKRAFDLANRDRWSKESPYDNPEPKICRKCKVPKRREDFAVSLSDKDGLQAWCRECCAVRHRQNPARNMLSNARARAKSKGIDFNIEESDLQIPETCPVLGIPIMVTKGQQSNSPSVDRIDNSQGYVKGNVRVISWRANDLKANATVEELELVLEDLKLWQKCKS